jgi:hypothetical protein
MAEKTDSFLRRWSRRKREAAREGKDSPPAAPTPSAAVTAPTEVPETAPAAAAPEESEGEASRRLGLPDIDSLDAQSDYTPFMRNGVPEGLRQKALRRLWRSDPVLANLDGLDMYHEDYTDAGTVVANLKTLYRVGRGYLPDIESETAAVPVDAPDKAASAESAPASGDAAPEAEAPAADHRVEAGGAGRVPTPTERPNEYANDSDKT